MDGNGREDKDEFEGFKPTGRAVKESGATIPIPVEVKRLPFMDVCDAVIAHMNKQTARWGMFPHKFHIQHDMRGQKIFLEETHGKIMSYISAERVCDCVAKWLDEIKIHMINPEYNHIKKIVDMWAARRESFPHQIHPVLELSVDDYTFHRLPFDSKEGDFNKCEFPAWRELINRMSNANAFCSFIGSLLDSKADRQQYVWIYGEGQNGKSSIGAVLCRLMGNAGRSDQPPVGHDKFWTWGLLGKRFVLFADCNNYSFPITGLFKSLTGGDEVRVEPKGQGSFSAPMIAKFVFFSNKRPNISSSKADTRRTIFCELTDVTEMFPGNYRERLWDEMPFFLHHCKTCYGLDMEKGGQIAVDDAVTQELVNKNEEDMQTIFDKYFLLTNDADKAARDRQFVEPYRMLEMSQDENLDFRKFKEWLEIRHKVIRQRVRLDGEDRTWRYLGLVEKPKMFQVMD